jgi:CIC family chloride channel protein
MVRIMARLLGWLQAANPSALVLLAVLVGVGGALGATIFHLAIALGVGFFYGTGGDFVERVEAMPALLRVAIPTFGGLLVGWLFYVARVREAEGEGVPEVVEALAVRQGTIRPIVAPVKIAAAALTLSSGGSAGREGPVIQIGSAIGSSIAQWCGMATRERSLLLACGAAAAIGGAFGAPFAGVVFTIEILRHQPTFLRIGLITTSALVGAGLTYLMTGHAGLRFVVDTVPDFAWWPVGAVALLAGFLSAGLALLFGATLAAGRIVFRRLPIAPLWRPALGGFLVGLLALWVPHVHEPAAYPLMVDLIALSSAPLGFLLAICILKMIATSITLGSGGVGGIFAPSLLLGTLLGSVVGAVLVGLGVIPVSTVPLLVLISMAAVFAAAAHAPITAALITYEMVGESELIVPLLIACFVAAYVARSIQRQSIYEHGV